MQASAHILLLLLALLLESYLRLQHRRRQAAGYLAFYWRTRSLLPLATRVTALGQVPLPALAVCPFIFTDLLLCGDLLCFAWLIVPVWAGV